jgi:hypothetical protein
MKWLLIVTLSLSSCAARPPHDEVWDEVERSLPKNTGSEWPWWAPRFYLPQAIVQPGEAEPTGWHNYNPVPYGIGLQWKLTF